MRYSPLLYMHPANQRYDRTQKCPLWEFVSCSSAWPVANALVGLGTEVLIVCQIIGAVIEEKAFRRANSVVLNDEPFQVVATIVRIAPLDELPP